MKKAHKVMTVFAIAVLAIIATLYLIYLTKAEIGNGSILFYKENCPYCKIVEDFIERSNITARINITKKDIHESQNQLEFRRIVNKCKISPNDAGVPLFYAGGKCYLGDEEIINFLINKLNSAEQE